MSNEQNLDVLSTFFTHISAVHEDAQNRVTALFSQIRQEALSLYQQNFRQAIDKSKPNSQKNEASGKNIAKPGEISQAKKVRRKEETKKLKPKQRQPEPMTIKIDDATNSSEEIIDENEPPVSQKIYECLTKTPHSKKYFAKKTGAKAIDSVPVKRKRDNSVLEEFENNYIAPMKRKISELIKAGISSKIIAKLYNLSPVCVEAIGNWKHYKGHQTSSKIKMKDQIMKLNGEGQSIKEISRTLNVWQNIVRDYLGEIPMNSLAKNNHVKKILVDKMKAGVPESQLSNLTGISLKNLSAWKKQPQTEWVDEDSIQSDGEIGREEIRETLYNHLMGNEASISNKKEKISRWLPLIIDDDQPIK